MDTATLEKLIAASLERLRRINPSVAGRPAEGLSPPRRTRGHRLRKVLVANRGEIAKRFFLALHEEGIPSVAVVTDPDRGQSWYEFADEVVFIGEHHRYSSIETVIAAARLIGANAIYSGYGFLSENPEFVEAINASSKAGAPLVFIGPNHRTMRTLGNKVRARELARQHDIPLFDSSGILTPAEMDRAEEEARRIGYPVMVKPVSGGGGKGMYPVSGEEGLTWAVQSCARIGRDLYGSDLFYIEKFIEQPVHIEVQVFNGHAIGIRKCAVQRRNQKIIEESGHSFLQEAESLPLMAAAETMARISGYCRGGGAGTVEFLFDATTGRFGFLEMNTRLQVEYAVTDQSLGIDLAKWQILYFDGREREIIGLEALKRGEVDRDHSIECRIYAEEPENDYLPSPGTIVEMDLPTFNGIRCDFGFGEGDTILPMYDPLVGKIIAQGATRSEAIIRLERALQELYIKGIKTNISQLLRIVRHRAFLGGDYTNNILLEHADLSFREREAGSCAGGARRIKHIIFGAFAEHVRLIQKSVRDFMIVANIEGYIEAPVLPSVPTGFFTEHRGARCRLDFLQVSMDRFYAYVDSVFSGTILIVSINDRSDDLLLQYGNSSYRIRINRHGPLVDLRMKDEKNKIDYFRLRVEPEGSAGGGDIATVLSPFQGTFVSFCSDRLKPGALVRRGEPLVVLSSMKMESVISAPEDGEIISLIEEGDASRLILTTTRDGRVIGRSVQEGELLVTIRTRGAGKARASAIPRKKHATDRRGGRTLPEQLMREDCEAWASKNPGAHLEDLMMLLASASQGFIRDQRIIDMLKRILKRIPAEGMRRRVPERTQDALDRLILQFTCVKRVFSPVLSESGLTYQEELNLHVERRRDLKLSPSFEEVMDILRNAYGLSHWSGRPEVKKMFSQFHLFLLRLSHQFCMEHTDLIQKSVQMLSLVPRPLEGTRRTLAMLLEQEQAERDDTLLKFIKRTFAEKLQGMIVGPLKSGATKLTAPGERLLDYRRENKASLQRLALKAPPGMAPEPLPPFFTRMIQERLSVLEQRNTVEPLFSPVMTAAAYRITPRGDGGGSFLIAYCHACYEEGGGRYDDLRWALGDGTWPLALHRRADERCWLELVTSGITLTCDDCAEQAGGYVTLRQMRGAFASAFDGMGSGRNIRGIVSITMQNPAGRDMRHRPLLVYPAGESVSVEFMQDSDRENPYCIDGKPNIVNQRLFRMRKWPIEIWASQCFDDGSMQELQVRMIDSEREQLGLDARPAVRPVGARIFRGTIGGSDALFYMKDSRISGGSTGNWEGLKYAAACYLAYLRDWPLYVWNDSAGANIMEGVVSLNRGAQGFMMNSLLTSRPDAGSFRRFLEQNGDPFLMKVFRALDLDFRLEVPAAARRRFQLIAVGIGPSAGLDVYGSSQASIQVMLDSEQTYRVLTGSSVIRTVIGEDISNYDIGGAKILGKWTGIVDIVARDKLQLISVIQRLHDLFTMESPLAAIRRRQTVRRGGQTGTAGVIQFSESLIREHTDDGVFLPFKEDYYASSACIGGFAKMGGRRVLILGARTDRGLKSPASIIKARELLRTAHRTACHQILIFGKRWIQRPDYHESASVRPHIDLMDTMRKKAGIRLHVVTDPEGLESVEINSTADAVIYVRTEGETHGRIAFTEKNAVFHVATRSEAFNLSLALLRLMDPMGPAPGDEIRPGGTPRIPGDHGTPYDILESVILPVFDAESFLEFYRDMNNPLSGPHLITGLARLDGATVGVIADQPLLKGGGADAMGTEKFRIFTDFCNSNGIPLVILSNSSGFVPGSSQERQRIQAIGAESLDVNIAGRIPVVSVVLNQNYGGRLIHAFNRFLRPGIVYLALEQAVLAVIGVEAAFDLLYGTKYERLINEGRQDEAAALKSEFSSGYLDKARSTNDALRTGLIDWTIPDIRDLRENLIRGLSLAIQRCQEAFGKIRGGTGRE
ncbi:MAG: hypothetical protein JXA20_02870 [Spirochaetes bacterium]|nr:hypothetical protein [Spirochaetota bacterium]